MVGSSEAEITDDELGGQWKIPQAFPKYFHIQRNSFYLEADTVPEHFPFYAIFIRVHPITSFPRKPTHKCWG